jgi:multicomponent Na+:H+ antiporter subunit C
MEEFGDLILARLNYWTYVVLMMIGLFAMITKKNLIKKLIGMSIFQTAIILFFVSVGVKEGATIPIIDHSEDHEDFHETVVEVHADSHDNAHAEEDVHHATDAAGHHEDEPVNPDAFANPLPHVLMLTAIVVGVATLGVGLAVALKVFIQYQTLEEDRILERIRSSDG